MGWWIAGGLIAYTGIVVIVVRHLFGPRAG